jgi:Histidine kinase-, DNA gyrase B-, and HSP90-like ATPase
MEPQPPQDEIPNKLGMWIEWMRRERRALAAVAVFPVFATILVALAVQPFSPAYAFPCPLYPNATVAFTASLHESCPLEYPDQIDAVVTPTRVDIVRTDGQVRAHLASGQPVTFRIQPVQGQPYEMTLSPILVQPGEAAVRLASACFLAMILVATVFLTAVRAGVPASLPFSLIHAVAGVGIVSTVAGGTTSAFEVGDALARATMAGAVMHLGLVFPQRRGIVEQFPELIAAPYVCGFIVSAVEIDAAYRGSAVSTALAQRLLMVLIGLGVLLLAAGCYYTVRLSASHLARGQARVFLGGLLLLSLPISLIGILGTPSLRLAAVTLLAALLPFPVGYAISRYEVADIDSSFRDVLAQALYLTLWSASFFVALFALQARLGIPGVLRHPTVMFAGIYGAMLPLDALRSRLKQRVRTLVVSNRIDWESLGREFAQRIAAQRSAQGIAIAVGDAVRSGLGETGVAILVAESGGFHLMDAVGVRAFVEPSLAEKLTEWSSDAVIDLNRMSDLPGLLKEAHDAGVCAFSRVEANGRLVGCLVLVHNRRSRMLGTSEKQWIATIASHTGSAIAAMQLEHELRIAERFAARGRMESELAHDIGKPLGALELTAQRLADNIDPEDPIVPQLRKITRIAAHVRELTRAALLAEGERTRVKLEDLVQVACIEVRSIHGDQRVVVHALPDLGELPVGFERLERVLANLLDNALRASGPDASAELTARVANGFLELVVEDRGAGMRPDQLRRAFEPFVSFRAGGTGLGLPICRQIVKQLGGSLNLTARRDGCGVIAIARVPLTP